ncbi:MAG: hypothetical protein KAI24_01905 [Planctomycetes bacterium]|nr:hypothetical protein [Planctomycetota bacterium]
MPFSLTRCALVATLAASSAFAQFRQETVPVTSNDPAVQDYVAKVSAMNLAGDQTRVSFVAQEFGQNFGTGTIVQIDSSANPVISYTYQAETFCIATQWCWGCYASFLGDCLFTVN